MSAHQMRSQSRYKESQKRKSKQERLIDAIISAGFSFLSCAQDFPSAQNSTPLTVAVVQAGNSTVVEIRNTGDNCVGECKIDQAFGASFPWLNQDQKDYSKMRRSVAVCVSTQTDFTRTCTHLQPGRTSHSTQLSQQPPLLSCALWLICQHSPTPASARNCCNAHSSPCSTQLWLRSCPRSTSLSCAWLPRTQA